MVGSLIVLRHLRPEGAEPLSLTYIPARTLQDPTTLRGAKSGALSKQTASNDCDLSRVIEAWPRLPGPIRRAVLALIGSE
jgi:hypothetical protein